MDETTEGTGTSYLQSDRRTITTTETTGTTGNSGTDTTSYMSEVC